MKKMYYGPYSIIMLFFLFISLIFWFLYLIKTMNSYRMIPPLIKKTPSKNLPLVSVIIPTRNESKRITPCIESLKNQDYPNMEVIIVDDSTDNTIDVIKKIVGKKSKFKIIKEEKLSGGWVGKPHAMQQGAKEAKGKWLLFIDADTSHKPNLITSSIKHAIQKKLDMLSILSHLECKSIWEKIIQPIPTGLLIFITPLGKTNDPKSKQSFALGPFILIKHKVFDKIGGYKKIRGKIADDVEMAKLLKNSGYKIGLARAYDMMNLRMYEKLKDIWEGWSKNIFMGLIQKREIQQKSRQFVILLIGLFIVFIMILFPTLSILSSILINYYNASIVWNNVLISAIFVWIISLLIQSYVHKKYSIGNPIFSPLYFIGGIVTILIFLNSAVKTFSGSGVKWKGRTYKNE